MDCAYFLKKFIAGSNLYLRFSLSGREKRQVEVGKSNDLGIQTARVTLGCLFPDCSLNGKVSKVIMWGGWADQTGFSAPAFVAGIEWNQQPHSPRKGHCSVPEGG